MIRWDYAEYPDILVAPPILTLVRIARADISARRVLVELIQNFILIGITRQVLPQVLWGKVRLRR